MKKRRSDERRQVDAARPDPQRTPRARQEHEPTGERRDAGSSTPASRSGGTTVLAKLSASAGIVAAMVLTVVVNVFVARHYKRWDWTRGGLYTLSQTTVATLHGLEEPVSMYVLLSQGDPLALSVRHLLDAYGAETTRLDVTWADPDRHPAEFLAVQQRFGIVPGKTEDGRIVTDAAIVVVRGDGKPYFITSHDLVEVEDAEDLRARPRLEQALTAGIRNVLGGERPRICFATGHGEKGFDGGSDTGLGPLKDRLLKTNHDVVEVPSAKELGAEKDPLPDCRVLVLAGPSERVPQADVQRMTAFLSAGGSALLAVGPVPDADDRRYLDLGLAPLLAAAGVKLQDDFVFELDPKRRSTLGQGETFTPTLAPHGVTEGLMKLEGSGLSIVLTVASSLVPAPGAPAAPTPLLRTSDRAFGMVDFFAWAEHPTQSPVAGADDHKGPLIVATATELPKTSAIPAGATHGARVVVVGSTSALFGANWQNPELRGTALFVESAFSWLAAQPIVLDIPNKPSFVAGLHLTEDGLTSVFRYVVVFIPLASVLLGVAVLLRRKSSEAPGRGNGARPAGGS